MRKVAERIVGNTDVDAPASWDKAGVAGRNAARNHMIPLCSWRTKAAKPDSSAKNYIT